ncbi:YicC/YloC family endoribonuclease [uncultured Roseobacter sp.]|uniref:YicC/YloC family endoribonuclease n=1 Tax=uncultured Roseobacter sp. TaxID=114847 RepID=UPI00260C96DA|nr:YicC/YloC family endoribonuclease [uncultured Roseobacter sp.]
MIRSMTGFASATGALEAYSWAWELRAVNGKGLDLRVRAPDWISGLEAALRKTLSERIARGNVTLSLRLSRSDEAGTVEINPGQLDATLRAIAVITEKAAAAGVTLGPVSPAEIISLRGVMEQQSTTEEAETASLAEALRAEADALIADFNDMRLQEGAALQAVISGQLDAIAVLTRQAAELAAARGTAQAEALRRNLARVMEGADGADPDRVAQELALLAVKSDVTEEIDRLGAHVSTARVLLEQGGPVGRKLDFLTQEFNREANTLCAKAQSTELTACGLDLKALVDQMREQVQNVE